MKASSAPSPGQLARVARELLSRAARGRPPGRLTRFFKPWERVYGYGIGTERWRAIGRKLYGAVRRTWSFADALDFTERMLGARTIEGRTLGIELLGRFERSFEPALLARAERWLATNRCDNWALTDDLSMQVLGPLCQRSPGLVRAFGRWARSDNLWVRRAAAVSLVPLVRRGRHLDAAYRVATTLLADEEDLVQKATGWLLREAGKTDPTRLQRYLLARGPRVPRTALRYAIELFPAARRRALLARTKGTPAGGGP